MSRVPAACRSSPQTTCSWVRIGTPITILAGYDGLTKAFFANVVPCKGTNHGYAERALAHNVLSTGHQKVILQGGQEPSIIDVNTKPARTPQPKSCTKKVQSETATPTVALSDRTKPSKDRFVQSRTTLNDRLVRRLVSTAQFLKWLGRHAAWTLTTFHIGSDGKTGHQRIRGKPFNQHIATFGEQILFKPHKTTGPQ